MIGIIARFIRQEATDSFPHSDFEIVAASGQIEHRTALDVPFWPRR